MVSNISYPRAHKPSENRFLEPLPDWNNFTGTLGTTWYVLTYGYGTLFLVETCIGLVVTIRYNCTLVRRRQPSIAIFGVLISGISMGMFSFIDPYCRWNRLPPFCVRIMLQSLKPSALAMYISLQNSLLYMSSAQVTENSFRRNKYTLSLTLFYFCLIVFTESLLHFKPNMKWIVIIPEHIFISLSIYLSVCFVYTGFKLSNKQDETRNMDDETSESSKDIYCDESFQSQRKRRKTSFGYKNPQSHSGNGRFRLRSKRQCPNSNANTGDTDSSDSKRLKPCVSDNQNTARSVISETEFLNKSFEPFLTWGLDATSNTELLQYISMEGNNVSLSPTANSDACIEEENQNIAYCRSTEVLLEDFTLESGYLADIENEQTEKEETIQTTCSTSLDKEMISQKFPVIVPRSFPHLRFYMIRQCRLVQSVVNIGYGIGFLLIVNTVFVLYAVFGVYGVFSTVSEASPWPWLLFQLLHRSVEFGLLTLLLVAISIIVRFVAYGRSRHKRLIKRDTKI
ncbi:hypothetical protein ACJMK2_008183 [Sinanodonta woodiana]|uniref:Proline-rich transmembrane protein 3/4 domain-containing protein n=1 Tax=Sinanodonta woodiana TaxID=1069815 RepID=A0ABD3VM08_SINWO